MAPLVTSPGKSGGRLSQGGEPVFMKPEMAAVIIRARPVPPQAPMISLLQAPKQASSCTVADTSSMYSRERFHELGPQLPSFRRRNQCVWGFSTWAGT
jgi:hypothetical protein